MHPLDADRLYFHYNKRVARNLLDTHLSFAISERIDARETAKVH